MAQVQTTNRAEEDPYYIPSVPRYKPLGDDYLDMDETIGDKFFDNYTELGTHTPQREIFDRDHRCGQNGNKENVTAPVTTESVPKPGNIRRSRSLLQPRSEANAEKSTVRNVSCERQAEHSENAEQNVSRFNVSKQPLIRRRSRSLIKPGRPSVGNKPPAQNSSPVHQPNSAQVNNKPVSSSVLAGSDSISSPVSTNRPTAASQPKPLYNVKPSIVNRNVFATKQPQTHSPMRLRSGLAKVVTNNAETGKQMSAQPENQTESSENIELNFSRLNTSKQTLVRRRSRSLIKPGRPSVGSKATTQNSPPVVVHRPNLSSLNIKPMSPKPATGPSSLSSPLNNHRLPTTAPNQTKPLHQNALKPPPAVSRTVFATKQHQVYSPRRLRSSSKDASKPSPANSAKKETSSSEISNHMNNNMPPTMRRVSGNYMAPTIASARRLSDVKERRRSRLCP